MKFQYEVGGIVNVHGDLVTVVEGSPVRVDFPQEVLHTLHKKTPGYVYLLAHTHPPEMTNLSHEDKTTLKAQALWMYPYPIRMSTITTVRSDTGFDLVETIYLGFWESSERWKELKKKGEPAVARQFTIIKECQRVVPPSGMYSSVLANISFFESEETCLT